MIKHILPLIRPEPWPYSALKLPKIQNHRGYHLQGAVENSLESFRQAAAFGGTCCELDVRLSRDQVPVVFHDEDLQRLKSRPEKISECTAQDLWQWAEIPSLAKVLDDDGLTPFFNIELKSNRIDDPLPRKVVEVIRRCQATQRVLFSSFNPASLFLLQNYAQEIPRALLASSEVSAENKWYLRNLLLAPLLRIHLLNLDQAMLTKEFIDLLNAESIPFAAWTVNEESEIRRLLKAGARSVITDLKISI